MYEWPALFFFFSSRRRHTRYWRDWSSDVCSSDLDCMTDTSIVIPNGYTLDGGGHTITAVDPVGGHFVGGVIQNGGATANVTRSEERRVGKEGRFRWAPYH